MNKEYLQEISSLNSDKKHISISKVFFSPYGFYALMVSIFAACYFLYIWNINFKLGTHSDELKKVSFILTGQQDFFHPILMLQVSRIVNFFTGLTDYQNVVVQGRMVSALFGVFFVILSYFLAKQYLSSIESLAVSAIVGLMPLTAIQARYLKEDIYVAPFVSLSAIALIYFSNRSTKQRAIFLGISIGIAVAAKYVAFIIIPIIFLVRYLRLCNDRNAFTLWMPTLFATGLLTFFLINFPALINPGTFISGIHDEINHVTSGHTIKLLPWLTLMVHHLYHSLIYGLGWPLVLAALAGISLTVLNWRSASKTLRIMLLFVAGWYLIHELIPMKGYIYIGRYMVATTPFVIIFAFVGIQTVLATMPKVSKSNLSAISILGLMLMAMAPAYKSWSVIKDARIDTRDVAAMAAERLTEAVIFDKYGNYDQSKRISYYLDKEKKSGERDDVSTLAKITHYFVTADLQYYRYLTGGKLPFQKSQVHRHAAMYNKIFERPFLEIRYRHGGMFYHQPTIRIADLRSDGAALLKLSHKKFWPAHVMVTFSPGTSQ